MIAVLEPKQAQAPGLLSKQRLHRPLRPSQVPNNLLPTQPAKTAEHRYNHSNSNRSRGPLGPMFGKARRPIVHGTAVACPGQKKHPP
jgi:hypothetical protein